MYTTRYKEIYYINGKFDTDSVEILCSVSGYGYTWKTSAKSLHAAKIAITKHLKENNAKY